METADSFPRFKRLPVELRLLVWEQHFLSPRIHLIDCPRGPRELAMRKMPTTVLLCENATFIPRSVNYVNRESKKAAEEIKERRNPFALAEEITTRHLENSGTLAHVVSSCKEYDDHIKALKPVLVNWDTDLLYIDLPTIFDPFCLLWNHSWTAKIQHISLQLDKTSIRHLGYMLECGRNDKKLAILAAEETLEPFTALRELLFVVRPYPGSEEWKKWPTGEYGFIQFDTRTDCDTGSLGAPIMLQRIIETYRDTIAELGKPIKLKTAVANDE